jgi:glycerophosphoryl diester phosphodiesterase
VIARAPRRPFLRSTSQFVRAAFGTVRAGGWRLIALYIGSQLAIIIVALPIIRWLFAEALRAGGMVGVDLAALVPGRDLTVTTLLIVIIAMLAFWLLSLQLALLVSAVGRVRAGETLRIRVVVTDLGHISRKLLRPSSIPLLGLLFILMPLANFGFLSVLTRAISVPAFITGELAA